MLARISHWLATRHEDKSGDDHTFVLQRYKALSRLKNATLDVLRMENALDRSSIGSCEPICGDRDTSMTVSRSREQRQPLTERDLCVQELCMALEECLVQGLTPQGDGEQPSWWHVLYASTHIIDEPTLVQSVLSAEFLSETDAGKARCWLKIVLNNHTIESSIMMIFSLACENLIHDNYKETSLVRSSEGLGIFLELIIALREVHFAIEVSGEPFELPKLLKSEHSTADNTGEMVSSNVDENIAAAARSSLSRGGSCSPPPDAKAHFEDAKDEKTIQESIDIEDRQAEVTPSHSALFRHRLKGIQQWQYVFGVSLASLSKNPYQSRYVLVDPVLALPNIVDDCVTILRQKPNTPRLFRTTVLSTHLNQLREIVETAGSVPADLDPQAAGALLLDFLKHLPDSLLTSEKYEAFVAAGQLRDEETSVRKMTCLVNDLPVHCQVVLKCVMELMHFLQQAEHREQNGVDSITASTVLAPVIAFKSDVGSGSPSERSRSRTPSLSQDVRYAAVGACIIERMIQHSTTIFHAIRVQIVDAFERLEAKKEALRLVSHQLKFKPQLNVLSDREQVNEISRLFVGYLEGEEGCKLSLHATEPDLVRVWAHFGFNRPSILENFEKGGVLMLQSVLYWVQTDPDALALLRMRALPSAFPSYDAGLVASSICASLGKMLNLISMSAHEEIETVAMSMKPFWKLVDEDMYFPKLFMLMFQVYDRVWSRLDPRAASFTRVMTETEKILEDLLKKAPNSVSEMKVEWEASKMIEDDEKKHEERQEVVGGRLAVESEPCLGSSSKQPCVEFKLDDYKFKLLDTSCILSLEHVAYLDQALPVTCQLCRWFRIYSVETNGSSLETLLSLAQKQRPTLLVVKDAEDNVFGGFASDEWHHALQYYGTGESFLFSFTSPSAPGGFVKYEWSRKNCYFMLCSDESLVMGGGGNFGLFLDSDLAAGTSGACETFNSPPLTTSQEFTCVHVELWGFTIGEKPTGLGGRHRRSVLE